MPKDLAMPIETLIGQSVRPRSCRAEPAAPRQMPAAAKRSGRRQGEGLPTPVKMADRPQGRYPKSAEGHPRRPARATHIHTPRGGVFSDTVADFFNFILL